MLYNSCFKRYKRFLGEGEVKKVTKTIRGVSYLFQLNVSIEALTGTMSIVYFGNRNVFELMHPNTCSITFCGECYYHSKHNCYQPPTPEKSQI